MAALTHYFPDTLKLTDFDKIFGIYSLEYIDADSMFKKLLIVTYYFRNSFDDTFLQLVSV